MRKISNPTTITQFGGNITNGRESVGQPPLGVDARDGAEDEVERAFKQRKLHGDIPSAHQATLTPLFMELAVFVFHVVPDLLCVELVLKTLAGTVRTEISPIQCDRRHDAIEVPIIDQQRPQGQRRRHGGPEDHRQDHEWRIAPPQPKPHDWPTLSTAKKASWGTSTEPSAFIRFFPFFCFSSSFRFREMSPP